jgi:hypothetical protein
LLKKYRSIADTILEKHFKPEPLHQKIDSLHALIKKDLANDPFPARRITNPHDRGYEDIVSQLKQFATKRYRLARQQLDQPGPRPKPHPHYRNPNHRQPSPGELPNGPTGLEVVFISRNAVKFKWKDNAENEAGHILQRASPETGGKFRNHIPRPGRSETQASDVRVVPGEICRYRVYAVFHTPKGPVGSKPSNVVVVTPPAEPKKK